MEVGAGSGESTKDQRVLGEALGTSTAASFMRNPRSTTESTNKMVISQSGWRTRACTRARWRKTPLDGKWKSWPWREPEGSGVSAAGPETASDLLFQRLDSRRIDYFGKIG